MTEGVLIAGGIGRRIPVVVVSVAVLPLGLLAALILGRWRGGTPAGWRQSVAEVAMVAGTLPWLWMILTPLPAPREVRLVPFVDLTSQLAGHPLVAFFQIGGNLLVFAAFGFFAPIRWRIGLAEVVALAAAASVTVEVLQYVLELGRVSSVDDIVINTAGAAAAAAASHRFWAARFWAARDAMRSVP